MSSNTTTTKTASNGTNKHKTAQPKPTTDPELPASKPTTDERCRVARPPDGGYGWVVCVMSFLASVIVDGVCFSVGIFIIYFMESFDVTTAKMSWVGSVLNGMYLSVGPIVGSLCNRFGCRIVCIAGSIFSALSFILSSFSPNVDVLILTYGAMAGFGFGLMYLPAIVMVGYYFEKRRAFATGIAVCGSGIGAFVFAPLTHYLLGQYSWRGACWIIGGISLQGVIIGALFRPLKADTPQHKEFEDEPLSPAPVKHLTESTKHIADPPSSPPTESSRPLVLKHRQISLIQEEESMSRERKYSAPAEICLRDLTCDSLRGTRHRFMSTGHLYGSHSLGHRSRCNSWRGIDRKDIFYTGSITHLPEYQRDPDTYHKTVVSSPPEQCEARGVKSRVVCIIMWIASSFILLKNPVFLIYGISCFLCMTGFFVPFIFLPDYALKIGLDGQQAAFLISIIGIANTVARVLCGFVSDWPYVDCLLLNNIALIMAGVATMLVPALTSYIALAFYGVVFGSGIAVFVSLRSIVVVELLGLDELTNAFGLVTMFQGLSSLIGAPIAGALYDATGNYSYSFYMAGSTLALAGVINLPLRRLAKCLEGRSNKNNSVQ